MSEENENSSGERDFTSEASKLGWVEKGDYRGSEREWVDAETFITRGEQINPILRANNERLKKEMESDRQKHSDEIKELRAATEEFKQFQKESFDRKQNELQQELASLKDKRKEAIREGDADLVVELEDQIDVLKEEKAKQPIKAEVAKPEVAPLDPTLTNWIAENKWFGGDIEATEIANGVGSAIRKQFPNLTGKDFLDKLDEKLQQRIPEVYENSPASRETVGSSSGRGAPASKKKIYDNLPPDAKAACDKFVKQKLFKSREEYVALYDWN